MRAMETEEPKCPVVGLNTERSRSPVADVDDVPCPEVLLLHFAREVNTAHSDQVGLVHPQADALEEPVVQLTGRGHWHGAHPQLHPWNT